MEYRRAEVRAGVFLLFSFVILVVMVFAVSDIQSLFKKKREVRVLFSFSDGVEKNAPVRYAGMKIGKVQQVRVATESHDQIELTLSIYQDMVIKKDTKAEIKSLGLVGGKYVELSGGTSLAQVLGPGEILHGEESLKLEDLTKMALDVVTKFKNIATNLDRIVGDPAMAKSLKATVQDLQASMENIKVAVENVKVMTSGKDEVAQTLKNLPELLKKIDESVNNLKALTEKSDKLVGENRKNIDTMIEGFRDMGTNLKDASEQIKESPWKLLRKP